jgi:hypothetical protein
MRASVAGGRRSPASLARIAPALQGPAQRGDRVGRHPLGTAASAANVEPWNVPGYRCRSTGTFAWASRRAYSI